MRDRPQGNRDALSGLLSAVELFRHHKREMPMQQAHMLLTIARHPGLSIAELGEALGLAQSSCSRNLYALGTVTRHGRPGLGLVRAEADPEDGRRFLLFLTDDGRAFVTRLLRCFDPADCYDRETAYRMARVETLGMPGRDALGRLRQGAEPVMALA